jgi:hypothetical protein
MPRKQVSQALTFHNISRTKNALKLNIAILRNKEDEMVQNNAYLIKKQHMTLGTCRHTIKTSCKFSHFEV